MASILDLLRKRNADREMSAADFITQCVKAEAAGESKKIDIGKLESAMIETGTTLEAFEAAVEREQRLTELRGVVAGLPDARDRFKELSQHAKARRVEVEAEITALRQEAENAAQAANEARRELDRCSQAEAELRRLLESPARKQARIEAKPVLSKLRQQRRGLEQEIVDLKAAISNVDARRFSFESQRDAYLADRQKKLDQAKVKLAKVVSQLTAAEAAEEEAERELAAAAAVG